MKLLNLKENDQFNNKQHISSKSEIVYLKSKQAAISKELAILTRKRTNMYTDAHTQYSARTKSNVGFRDSPEFIQYVEQHENVINSKINKLQQDNDIIIQRIRYLSSVDLFNEQKAIYTKLGEPTTIPNPGRIVTGPITSILNPTHEVAATDTFIGTPWDYPWWTDKSLKQYIRLSKYLKSQNMGGFTKVYAAKLSLMVKAIMLSSDGTVIWRITVTQHNAYIIHSSIRINGHAQSTKSFLKTIKP